MTRSWIRPVAFTLLAIVVVAGIAVAWLVTSFDANRYKGLAVDWVKREYDRTLTIDGPVDLAVFPRVAVRVTKLRLSERGRADEFAAVDDASLSLELWPLLSKQLVVQRVSANGVRVAYLRDAQGRSNIDDLLAPKEGADAAAKPDSGDGAGVSFDVGAVQLDNVKVNLRDDVTPLRGELTLETLKTGRLASGVESPVSLRVKSALTEPSVQGVLSGDTQLRWEAGSGAIRLRDMKLRYQGEAVGLKAIDATVQGNVSSGGGADAAIQVDGLKLDGGGAMGELRLVDSSVAIERFGYEPARKALALQNLRLRVNGRQGADPLALEFDWPRLEATADAVKGSDLKGKFTLGGASALEGSFASGPPSGRFERLDLPGVKASLKGRSGAREIDGTARADVTLRPADKGAALERLDVQARVADAGLAPLQLAIQGQADVDATSARWKFTGRLAPAAAAAAPKPAVSKPAARKTAAPAPATPSDGRFSTDGTARLGGAVPDIQMRASFDSLDLDRLLPGDKGAAAKGAAASAPAPAASAPGPTADAPVDLSGLRSVDGRFSLQAGRLVSNGISVTDARLEAGLRGGVLKLDRLQGKAWGGTIDASGNADAKSNRVGVKLAGRDVDVHALLRDTADFTRLEGTGRVDAELATQGATVGEMKRRLDGTAALQLRDGAIRGVNLAKTFRQAKAALTLRQDAVQRAAETEKTDFSALSATFRITNGVARNDDLDMKSPFLRLGGSGAIDVGRSTIDYTARATVAATSKGQEGAELAALRGLTIPVRLTGALDAIDWQVQWSAVAAGAIGNKLQDRLRDSLGDRLMGGDRKSDAEAAPGDKPKAPARPEDRAKDRLRKLLQ